ncbi:MAG: hypothetical protein JW846_00050 [Dehalococcoidia bacterium]|nr:hypothetical protein [Dehalococcoidia bacterium]
MNTLKELIEGGEYELAAYRLVYGVFRTHLQESQHRTCSHWLPSSSCIHAGMVEKERMNDGQA